jgi:hypothetical protein
VRAENMDIMQVLHPSPVCCTVSASCQPTIVVLLFVLCRSFVAVVSVAAAVPLWRFIVLARPDLACVTRLSLSLSLPLPPSLPSSRTISSRTGPTT